MSHDTEFPTSYDREPVRYTPFFQEVLDDAKRQLSRKMRASASEYVPAIAEVPREQVFQEAEAFSAQEAPAKYYVAELRSSEGRVIFKEGFLLDIELSKENGLFFFQNTRFNIFGSGFAKEEALKDFSEFFIRDYLSYKDNLPEELTQDARQLLDEYKAIIATFEPA
ncbi:MAG: hypothetical protein WBC42_08820 [Candidatus Zixiibacteriota bacterium]